MLFRNYLLAFAAAAVAVSSSVAHAERAPSLVKNQSIRQENAFGVAKKHASAVLTRGGAAAKKVVAPVQDTKSAAVLMGLVLAFNSGFVNGCALSGFVSADGAKQAVAAVTASWTNGAMGLASGNTDTFLFLSKVIIAFISGSTIAALLNPKPVPFQITGSQFMLPFFVSAAALCGAGSLFDSPDTVKTAFYLCCVANGIQNSVTSTLTANLCRTSHFTGISSDMGTFLGQCLRGNKENAYKLKVFAGLAACFWLGGYTSYGVAKKYESLSLYFAAGLHVFVGAMYEKIAKALF